MEEFSTCHKNEKKGIKEYEWLKYFYFENSMSLMLPFISIVLELLLLIVYLAVKKTKNMPNKILIAFCVALLICDVIAVILTLINTVRSINTAVCKTVALLLHYFSLALCTWPCIIAFDLWKIMRSTNTMNRQSFLYLRYNIIAWGIPVIVASTCLSVDLIKDGSLIRYVRIIVGFLPFMQGSWCT